MNYRIAFLLVTIAGVTLSVVGISFDLIGKSNPIGAGLFALQGALVVLYYLVQRKHVI